MTQRLSGFRIGRIGGVPITVAPTGLLSVAVIAALGAPVVARVVPGTGTAVAVGVAVLLAVLLAASVLAHEIGHCIAARLLGLTVVQVRLYLLGGVSELAGVPRSPREESIVAAVGPAVSAVLAGVFFLGVPAMTPGTAGWLVLMLLALANLAVAVFNLLPALPLDGGRVLRAGVWRASGNRRAGTAAAVFGGYLVAAALAGWAVVLLVADGAAALPAAGLALLMALFVLVGAVAERDPGGAGRGRLRVAVGPPTVVPFSSVVRPFTQLPADTPVGIALAAAAEQAVILTESDGVGRGLLDLAAARTLAERNPQAPASLAARHFAPQDIVLADDDPAEVAARIRTGNDEVLLLVDDAGRPAGVLRREDFGTRPPRKYQA